MKLPTNECEEESQQWGKFPQLTPHLGWRRGSVIRTLVFGWRTFPDLCLIYGWQVTTFWVDCPLGSANQANSTFHPFRVGKSINQSIIILSEQMQKHCSHYTSIWGDITCWEMTVKKGKF